MATITYDDGMVVQDWNEVQTITLTDWDGTEHFHLTMAGVESDPITRGTNATAAGVDTVITALIAAAGLTGTCEVTGTTDAGPYTVEFTGGLAKTDVPAMTVTSPSGDNDGTVAETRKGGTNRVATNIVGHAGVRAALAGGSGRPMKFVTGKFSFGTHYHTGGESLTNIVDNFDTFMGIHIEDPLTSAGTGKRVVIDYTAGAEKALLYDNAVSSAEVVDATDQSGAADLRFIAWGF